MSTSFAPAVRVKRSERFFNNLTLPIYDLVLYGLISRHAWDMTTARLDAHYQRYTLSNHLEVGVGTGYLLDRVEFPSGPTRLALMDLSEPCLAKTARRVARHAPEIYVQNLLEPMRHQPTPFDSIALNYVMHCVPGNFMEKHVAFQQLATLLGPHGVLFGTTVLGAGVRKNWLARPAMWLLNAIGLFNNRQDSARDLERFLRAHFQVLEFDVVGVVAVFAVRHKAA
ncbi:MAG TPA: class I SAM-dependent methyltransferase [Burkholderiaceae bacterium]